MNPSSLPQATLHLEEKILPLPVPVLDCHIDLTEPPQREDVDRFLGLIPPRESPPPEKGSLKDVVFPFLNYQVDFSKKTQ